MTSHVLCVYWYTAAHRQKTGLNNMTITPSSSGRNKSATSFLAACREFNYKPLQSPKPQDLPAVHPKGKKSHFPRRSLTSCLRAVPFSKADQRQPSHCSLQPKDCHTLPLPSSPGSGGPTEAKGRSQTMPSHSTPCTYQTLFPTSRWMKTAGLGLGELLLSQQREVTRLLV